LPEKSSWSYPWRATSCPRIIPARSMRALRTSAVLPSQKKVPFTPISSSTCRTSSSPRAEDPKRGAPPPLDMEQTSPWQARFTSRSTSTVKATARTRGYPGAMT